MWLVIQQHNEFKLDYSMLRAKGCVNFGICIKANVFVIAKTSPTRVSLLSFKHYTQVRTCISLGVAHKLLKIYHKLD